MKNNKHFGWIALFAIVILAFAVISVAGAADPESAQAESAENNVEGGTWCWFGLCNHPSKYITYSTSSGRNYWVRSEGDEYEYIGKILTPGNSSSITTTTEYSISISAGLEVGTDACKASLGITGSMSIAYSYTDNVNNDTGRRGYVHSLVEYEERQSFGVNTYTRYLYPYQTWGFTYFNTTCLYDCTVSHPRCRVPTGFGYECLNTKIYSSNIAVTYNGH